MTARPNTASIKSAVFVEPMDCELVSKLPEGPQWVYEIKLDGYRAVAVKAGEMLDLFSRRHKSFNNQYSVLVDALMPLPNGTVLDGEIVALDDSGRPQFNLLQNYRAKAKRIRYFVFDLLCVNGRDITKLPLMERRELLRQMEFASLRIHLVDYHESSATDMLAAVKGLGLEGVVAKRRDSRYEPGMRTGAWQKLKVHSSHEFVIGGYFPGPHGFDSIVLGYYRGKDLMYVARTRNGFVPASRRSLFAKLKPLAVPECPFVNLPETHPSRFGRELDTEAMKKAVWLRPDLVAQIEYLEWTAADRLRHSRFVGLRDDKRPSDVVKETT